MSLSSDRRAVLELALSRTDALTERADLKGGVIAALLTGFTAVLITSDRFLEAIRAVLSDPASNTTEFLALIVTAAATLAAALSVFVVLFPRTRADETSCLYFGEIARHKDAASLTREVAGDGFDPDKDLAAQVLVCSKICSEKMHWVRIAAALTATSIISCGIFMVLETIG